MWTKLTCIHYIWLTEKTAIKTVIRNVNGSDKSSSQTFYKYETQIETKNTKEIQEKKCRLYTLRSAPHTVPFCIFKTSAAEF